MLFVTDTSTLIALRRLGWLDLCKQNKNRFIWPPSVTMELKRRKRKNKEIFDLLKTKISFEMKIQNRKAFDEISRTDADVITLAMEHNATVLSEDELLRKKATKFGVPTFSLPAFCIVLYQRGFFSKDECLARLKTLHEKKFLSQSYYRQYLQGLMP